MSETTQTVRRFGKLKRRAILALLLLQPAAEKHARWGGDAAAAQDAGRQGESLYQS